MSAQEWKTIPLRYVCELNPSVAFDEFDEDDDLTFLPMDRVKNGYFIPNSDKFSKYGASYTAFENGDIVLAKVTPCFENGNIAIVEHLVGSKGFGSSELFVIRPTVAERRFLFYYFQSSIFKQDGEASMTGAGGLKRVSPDVLRQHHLPFPSQDVQRLIADYLDRETTRIDGLIVAKERMLALLDEKRAALISRVVIRGLDPKVPMKPSGQEWLGEIPAHWDVMKIKHGFRIISSGTTPPTNQEHFYEGEIPWVTTSELRENVVTSTDKRVSDDALQQFSALRIYGRGTVLFAMYGATIGRVALLGLPATVNQAVCALSDADNFDSEYVFYALQASRTMLISHATGGGQSNLNTEKVREHKLPLPPMNEQKAITSFLGHRLEGYKRVNAEISRSLERLKERRAALITAAVTGQIPLEKMTG